MRRRRLASLVAGALCLLGASGCATASTGHHPEAAASSPSSPTRAVGAAPGPAAAPADGREGVPAFAHVFVVVMENLGAQAALAVPPVGALAARYESTTGWYATGHPSLPNYLAMVSGSTGGVTSDCTACIQRGDNLAAQLEAAGISWRAYFGGMPSPCFLGPESPDGSYAQKHDPFAYFEDVRSSPAICAHLQPLNALDPLLAGPASGVARLVWVTPDMCDSGHDCPAAVAGAWLSGLVNRVTASAAWRNGGVLVVTWDEGYGEAGMDPGSGVVSGGGGGGAVLALVITPGTPAGRRLAGPFSHYSLLRTIEDALGLPLLGDAGAGGVHALGAFFQTGAGGSGSS